MMNRPLFKRVFPQILFCAGLVVLCGAIALAQDQAPVDASCSRPPRRLRSARTARSRWTWCMPWTLPRS